MIWALSLKRTSMRWFARMSRSLAAPRALPEVERLRMLYGMIDKISADLVKLTIEDIWLRH
jgi:hypothetical protein